LGYSVGSIRAFSCTKDQELFPRIFLCEVVLDGWSSAVVPDSRPGVSVGKTQVDSLEIVAVTEEIASAIQSRVVAQRFLTNVMF